MTHTPTPADIETLREIHRQSYAKNILLAKGHAILDRLSPPESEQPDEATVWTRKVIEAWHGDELDPADEPAYRDDVSRARQVLSDLIASKDAEKAALEEFEKWAHGEIDRYAQMAKRNQELAEKAESELAALRAENERLKEAIAKYVSFDQPEIAERNTAEPVSDWPEEVAGRSTDTAPVVEVTQADRDVAAEIWNSYVAKIGEVIAEKAIREGASDDTMIVQTCARHRTEAEARGRREALEEARKNIRDRLYPKNPESDWTPYARDRAAAANSADDELRYLLNGGRRP